MEALPLSFFCRPAEVVGPDLVGCRLVKRQTDGSLLWGVIVETEAYSQDDPACHGYRRISSYLGKQTNLELIALDPFNSDLSPRKK